MEREKWIERLLCALVLPEIVFIFQEFGLIDFVSILHNHSIMIIVIVFGIAGIFVLTETEYMDNAFWRIVLQIIFTPFFALFLFAIVFTQLFISIGSSLSGTTAIGYAAGNNDRSAFKEAKRNFENFSRTYSQNMQQGLTNDAYLAEHHMRCSYADMMACKNVFTDSSAISEYKSESYQYYMCKKQGLEADAAKHKHFMNSAWANINK